MTLIISLATHDYVLQASDRRVTRSRNGEVTGHEDERNKAIFVAERLSFAMTGIADVDGDTVEFFAAQMARHLGDTHDVRSALDATGKMFAQHLSQRHDRHDRRLTFVGVGWTDVPPAPRSPLLIWTSNSMDASGEWTMDIDDVFATGSEVLLADEPMALLVSGVGLSDAQRAQLQLDVVGAITASDDPAPVAEILINHIRAAAGLNALIGTGVMVNCIPYACGSPDGGIMFIGGPPKRDGRTFTYVPPGKVVGPYLGPHVVGSHGERLEGFQGQGVEGTFGFSYGQDRREGGRVAVGQRIKVSSVGRNDPCWCGSGKKFKRCHGG